MYGQELNPKPNAICKAVMLIKGQDIANIIFGKPLPPKLGAPSTPLQERRTALVSRRRHRTD